MAENKNNAALYDTALYRQAGVPMNPKVASSQSVDPKCLKSGPIFDLACKEKTKAFLRIRDEQRAVNRYRWKNIPANITSQELERMIYYKGQLCLFYHKALDQFYFMPYALDGTIDFYGRYNRVHPVPMSAGTDDKGNKAQAELLSTIKLDVIYTENQEIKDPNNSCALIHDYTKQLSQTIIPRVQVNDSLLDVQANCVPYMDTNMLNSTGVTAVTVQDGDEEENIGIAAAGMKKHALSGIPFIPVRRHADMQELTDKNVANSQDFMMAMQSLDNLVLSGYGIANGGVFEKKEHKLQDEEDTNKSPDVLVYQDGLDIRKNFCTVANKIIHLVKPDLADMTVEENEDLIDEENDSEEEEFKEDEVVEENDGGSENE